MPDSRQSVSQVGAAARRAVKARFATLPGRTPTDDHGYVRRPEANLVRGVSMEQFEKDLRQGDGNELRMKFCAVHSSAALVVNTFARFKSHPEELVLKGQSWHTKPQFEKQLPIVPGRRPANLDMWLECENRVLAVESKFLEYLTPKAYTRSRPPFASAYSQLPSSTLDPWKHVLAAIQRDHISHFLDRAQLLKHLLGLQGWLNGLKQADGWSVTLLYLFWEPTDWEEIAACRQHRDEVAAFVRLASGQRIAIDWWTYQELWTEWDNVPALAGHSRNLRDRYEVGLSPL